MFLSLIIVPYEPLLFYITWSRLWPDDPYASQKKQKKNLLTKIIYKYNMKIDAFYYQKTLYRMNYFAKY